MNLQQHHLLAGQGFAGVAVQQQKSINIIKDGYKDNRSKDEPIAHAGVEIGSVLVVPIYNKNRLIVGVLEVVNKKKMPKKKPFFTEQDQVCLCSSSSLPLLLISLFSSLLFILPTANCRVHVDLDGSDDRECAPVRRGRYPPRADRNAPANHRADVG
jgi:hypothetical protein